MKKIYSLLLLAPLHLFAVASDPGGCAGSLTIADENPPCPLQDVTFVWAEQTPAAEYRLKIGTSPGGQEEAVIGAFAIGTNETYTTSTPLFEGATYYATVEYTLDDGTTFTPCDTMQFDMRVLPTAPTSITLDGGDNTSDVCYGQDFDLEATGGTEGSLGTYEWSTDNFSSTIPGETSRYLTVTGGISSGTTYYVRRVDADCGTTSGSTSITLTVSGGALDPITETEQVILSGATVCPGTNSPDLTFNTVANAPAANTDILWELREVTGGGNVLVTSLADVATFNVDLHAYNSGNRDFVVLLINQSCPHGDFTEETFAFSTNDIPTYTTGFDGFSVEELGVNQEVNGGNTVATICDGANLLVDMSAIGNAMGLDWLNTSVELFNVSTASTIDGPDNLVIWGGNDSTLTVVDVFAAAASDGDIIEIRVNRCAYGSPLQVSSFQFTLEQAVGGDATGSTETYTDESATTINNNDEVCPGELIDIAITGAANLGTNGEYRVYKTIDAGASFTLIANGTDPISLINHDHGLFDAQYHTVIVNDCDSVPVSSININVSNSSTAPTSVTSDKGSLVCPGTTVKFTAIGGTLGAGGVYQYSTNGGGVWNTTGNAGADDYIDLTLNSTATVLFRIQDGCGNHPSIAPFPQTTVNTKTISTPITAANIASTTVCPGEGIVCHATGGTLGTSAVYQYTTDGGTTWNVTGNAGTDNFIALQANTALIVGMRILDSCDASVQTNVFGDNVGVYTVSTTPASVSTSPSADTVCAGTLVTYTANGGILGDANAGYEYSTDGGTTWLSTGNAGADNYIDVIVFSFVKVHMRISDDCGVYPTSNEPFDSTEIYTENTAPTTLTPSEAGPVCADSEVTFTADGSLGNRGDEQYEYSTNGGTTWMTTGSGGDDNFITLTVNAAITVDMRINGGCTDVSATVVSATVNVIDALNPITSMTNTNDNYCANSPVSVIIRAFYGVQPSNANVVWYIIDNFANDTTLYKSTVNTDPESDTIIVAPTKTTTYGARIESVCDTTDFEVVTITVKDTSMGPNAIAPDSSLICNDKFLTFEASGFKLGAGASFQWVWDDNNVDGGESVLVNSGGSVFSHITNFSSANPYYIKARIVGECNTTAYTSGLLLEFGDNFVTVPSATIVVCAGETVMLNALVKDAIDDQPIQTAPGVTSLSFSGTGVSGTDFVSTTSGTYTVTATVVHSSGCEVEKTFDIQVLDNPSITVDAGSIIAANCNGSGTGAFEMNATGGAAPYTVKLNGGTTATLSNVASGQVVTFNNLMGGTHNIEVKDNKGCSSTSMVVIPNSTGLVASIDYTNSTHMLCFDKNNGVATIAAAGGQSPYTYAISSDGGTTYSSNLSGNVFSGLSPYITYWFRVADANGCESFTNHTMGESTAIDLLVFDYTNQSCADIEDGSMNFLATGGSGVGYEFSLNGGSFSSSTFVNKLAAATYSIIIKDDMGCESKEHIFSLTAPDPIVADTAVIGGNETVGFNVEISAVGGTGGYEISVNGGEFTTDLTIIGLDAPATHTVVVRDSNGCETTLSFFLDGRIGIADAGTDMNIEAFPNPFNNEITLTGVALQTADIIVTDMYGKRVNASIDVDADVVKINTANFAKGVYLINIVNNGELSIKRMIKQ